MLIPPFDKFDDRALSVRDIARGEVLFREKEPTRGMYMCLDAAVNLVRVTAMGDRVVIHRAAATQSFAEASVFSERYHCDAVCQKSGQVVRIDREAVITALSTPDFAIAYNRLMARQLQKYRQIMEILSIKSADDRVLAGVVCGLLEGSVMDFAARLSLTHEATFRSLRRLVQRGQLTNPRRGIYRLNALRNPP